MNTQFELTNRLVHGVLQDWWRYEWTKQGFGMVRTYLDSEHRWRVNVWSQMLAVRGVSTIHDHPWSFTSHVISGAIINRKYEILGLDRMTEPWKLYDMCHIVTGEGGGPASSPETVMVRPTTNFVYLAGMSYEQRADVLHETIYREGTVTVNDRSAPTAAHTARVMWPHGTEWVDAKPRPALDCEVMDVCSGALANWDYTER